MADNFVRSSCTSAKVVDCRVVGSFCVVVAALRDEARLHEWFNACLNVSASTETDAEAGREHNPHRTNKLKNSLRSSTPRNIAETSANVTGVAGMDVANVSFNNGSKEKERMIL